MSTEIHVALRNWVSMKLDSDDLTMEPLIAEASTRRFWRISANDSSWVAMHSPPATENNEQFIRLSRVFSENGVPVPRVIANELATGFLLVEDVGDRDLRSEYIRKEVSSSLAPALDALLAIQNTADSCIPPYTKQRFHDELDIFKEWICEDICAISDEPVSDVETILVDELDSYPKVTVHRDFHSRNLLVSGNPPSLGVVDFQDALRGPITYDVASLLFDCYYNHTDDTIKHFINSYLERSDQDLGNVAEANVFSNAVRATAVQRLLKAAGIFVRLWRTRGRNSHLGDVEPTLKKAVTLCRSKPYLEDLGSWLETVVTPKATQKLSQI